MLIQWYIPLGPFWFFILLSSIDKNHILAFESSRNTIRNEVAHTIPFRSCHDTNHNNLATFGVQQHHLHHNSYKCMRGGDIKNENEEQENRELDAYIEELIASVDEDEDVEEESDSDDDDDDDDDDESSEHNDEEDEEDTDEEEEDKEVEEEDDSDDDDEEEEDSDEEKEGDALENNSSEELVKDETHNDNIAGDDDVEVESKSEDINDEEQSQEVVGNAENEEASLSATSNSQPDSTSNNSGDRLSKTKKSGKKKSKNIDDDNKRRRRKRKETLSSSSSSSKILKPSDTKSSSAPVDSISKDDTSVSGQSPSTATAVYHKPNALYRFLLGQGRIGHFVVMLCIAVVEFIQRYIPEVMKFYAWIMVKIFGTSYGLDSQRSRQKGYANEADGVSGQVNAKYAAFVSTDGSTVRGSSGGKRKKALTKKADQAAAERLRQIGSIREAKYRHLSIDFMKRHHIGPFSTSESTATIDESLSDGGMVVPTEEGTSDVDVTGPTPDAATEDESDVDWVVEAFSGNADDAKDSTNEASTKSSESYVEPTMSVGLGSTGATVSVGLEIGFGNKKKKRSKKSKRPTSVLEAVTERKKVQKRIQKKPKASDSEGGGGVLGRIRAASANSLIARNLSGAYPGDAVPPIEAGDANGVIELARKYGYGDWSDDEDEDEDDDDTPTMPKRRRKKVRKTTSGGVSTKRKKKRLSSTKGSTLSVGFDLNAGSSGRSRREPNGFSTTRQSRRSTATLSSTKKKKSPSSKVERSDILKPSKADIQQRLKSERMVRLPTQRLKEKELQDRLRKDKE